MQRFPAAVLTPADDHAGKAGGGPAASMAAAADPAQERLLNAARRLLDAQGARRQAHAEAVQALVGFSASPVRSDGKLAALRDALAGAALSEKLDRPREDAAGREFRNRLSGGKLGNIWKQLAEMIRQSEQGDLADHAAGLDRYTALYQSIVDILSKLEKWVRADGDNHMRVDLGNLRDELDRLLSQYHPPSQNQLIAGNTPYGGVGKDQADAVCKKLGLDPGACIYRNADGTYCVIPDLSQIKKMRENLPMPVENNRKLSIAAYNAWKAGFDSQMSRIEDALQTRGQKYSNAYSRFENFHKTISSIIQSMADMLRQFLQF